MFSKPLGRHEHRHGHGHHRKHGHGGKFKKFGRHTKHFDHHMGKHHFSMKATDLGRRCFSESDIIGKNMEPRCPGRLDHRINFMKRHYGRHGRCCFEKNDEIIEISESKETPQNSSTAMPEEDTSKDKEQTTDVEISTEVSEKQKNNKHHQRHYRRHMGHGHKNRIHKYFCNNVPADNVIIIQDENSPRSRFGHHDHPRKRHSEEMGRRHHGGRHGHGPKHHRRCRHHGCCKKMVDVAVNTDTCEFPDATNEPNMEQDVSNDAAQEETSSLNVDQVTEVTNNLEKSSLE